MRRTAPVVLSLAVGLTAAPTAVAAPVDADDAAGRPNLTLSRAGGPSTVTARQRARFSVAVRNAGTARAARSVVKIYLSHDRRRDHGDILLGALGTGPIPAGGTRAVATRFRVPAALGPRYLVACADARHQVAESRESDNCRAAARQVWVRPPAKPYVVGTVRPRRVAPTLGTATASKRIGPEGGVLTLRDHGNSYRLTVPAKALVAPVKLTMRPITELSGLGMSGGLVAGVDLRPDGLAFLRPVTVAITPKSKVPLARQTGFAFQGSGKDLHHYGLEPGATPVLALTHFTGVGVGSATATDRASQDTRVPAGAEAQWEQQLAGLKDDLRRAREAALAGTDEQQALDAQNAALAKGVALMMSYLGDVAVPRLREALAGDTTRLGPAAIRRFLAIARQLQLVGAPDDPAIDAGWRLVEQIFDKMIPDAQRRCVAEHDPGMAVFMLAVARQQQLIGRGDQAIAFAAMNKCLHFELDYDFAVDGDGYSDLDGDGYGTTFSDFGFRLAAKRVPIDIHVEDLTHRVTGSGPEGYLAYYGRSTTTSYYYNSDGDQVPCSGAAEPTGRIGGTFRVEDLSLDLNYYADDPQYQAPFRLETLIDPGQVGAATAPQDVTTYTSDTEKCQLPVGEVHNWLWGLQFYFAHLAETEGDGAAYRIRDWTPGAPGSGVVATKVYDRDLPSDVTHEHELTTLTLRHTPRS